MFVFLPRGCGLYFISCSFFSLAFALLLFGFNSSDRAALSATDLFVAVKDQMSLKEGQSIRVDSTIAAPVCSECSVVFLCLVNDSEFIQLMREGLIGVHMVEVSIVAGPVKLESS